MSNSKNTNRNEANPSNHCGGACNCEKCSCGCQENACTCQERNCQCGCGTATKR